MPIFLLYNAIKEKVVLRETRILTGGDKSTFLFLKVNNELYKIITNEEHVKDEVVNIHVIILIV